MARRLAVTAALLLGLLAPSAVQAHYPAAGRQPVRTVPVVSPKMPAHWPESGSARYTAYQWGWAHCGYGGWTCDTSVSPVVGTEDWGVVGDHSRQIYVRWYERASYRRKCYAVLRVDHYYSVAQVYVYDCVRV